MTSSGPFSVRSEGNDGSRRLRPVGELDIATAPALERELDAAASGDAEIILVDLSQLTFMDSSGIHLLLRASETWGARDNRLRIITGPPLIDRVFGLACVRELLPLVSSDGRPSDYAPAEGNPALLVDPVSRARKPRRTTDSLTRSRPRPQPE